MSMTQAEKERWIAELTRLNAEGWRDAKLARVQAIRAAHPDWDYDWAWDQAEREQQNPAPEPTSIGEATKLVQAEHPGWTFQQSWDYAESTYPKLVKGADTLARDPRLAQEFSKIKKLGDVARSAKIGDHVALLAKIRKLMQEQNLSFDEAFTEITKQNMEARQAAASRGVPVTEEQAAQKVAENIKLGREPFETLPTQSFEEWLDDAVKRQKERPAHVEALEHVEAIEWQPGKRLLIRGSEAVFVD